jgi:hypothetical protein
MRTVDTRKQLEEPSLVQIDPHAVRDENVPAWEQLEAGRYRPRRIRGSFPGRELG